MRTERVEFQGHTGETLAGRLDLPERGARGFALFAHCFTCGKDIAAARRIAQGLTQAGFGVLRFDFTGLGHSKGEFGNTGFSGNLADLKRAEAWLAEHHKAPSLLIGHSWGGSAALAVAGDMPSVKAVVSIGSPFDVGHVSHNFKGDLERVRAEGAGDVTIGGRSFTLERSFLEDIAQASLGEKIASMKTALLVLHAPQDDYVGIENASQIFLAAKHPKSFVSLDDADHLITQPKDAAYAANLIAAWASRYAPLAEEAARPDIGEGETRASEADAAGFLQDIFAGEHAILADEPKSVGGSNLGLTPYQLVSAGLAACTSMTIRMYARRKGLPLEHVAVDVSHDRIHAADCEECEAGLTGRIDQFTRRIHLTGDLSAEQIAKLGEIADKCPVHRTLENTIHVKTVIE